MPSKPDKRSETGYRNTVFVDKDFKEAFNRTVMNSYYAAVEQMQSRAANLRPAPDKPERISEQTEKAAKEADRHNAALPTKEKAGKNREAGRG